MARATSNALLGLFLEPDQVAQAVERLRAAGFAVRDLEVLSDAPYPEGAFGEAPVEHKLFVFPLVGALAGFGGGLLLTIGTQLSYPIVTGGKPILSIPPMINIIFEGTMLGAILATIGGVLFESRLSGFEHAPYDPRISEGYLGVAVNRASGRELAAERVLREAGAIDVVKGGG